MPSVALSENLTVQHIKLIGRHCFFFPLWALHSHCKYSSGGGDGDGGALQCGLSLNTSVFLTPTKSMCM